jgi:TonB family protein
MDGHDRKFAGYRHAVVALTTAAALVAGLMVPMEARSLLLNGPVTVTSVAARRLKVGGSVRPPKKLVDVKPDYPEDARAAKIEGVVILGIVIGEDGSVIDSQVLRSIPALDQAALDAVSQWEFEPTLLNGEAVEIEMAVTVNFTLGVSG